MVIEIVDDYPLIAWWFSIMRYIILRIPHFLDWHGICFQPAETLRAIWDNAAHEDVERVSVDVFFLQKQILSVDESGIFSSNIHLCMLPSGKRYKKLSKDQRSTIFNGKTHYFYGHFQELCYLQS
jgi:hypothetical protein